MMIRSIKKKLKPTNLSMPKHKTQKLDTIKQ